jgi:hypothetical protein
MNTPSENRNVLDIHSHTLCSSRGCVEVVLDHKMSLVHVSDVYNPNEHFPTINTKTGRSEFRPVHEVPKVASKEEGNLMGLPDLLENEAKPKKKGGCSSCAEKAKKRKQEEKSGLLKRLAKGVPGLLKSELGIDQADQNTVARRKSVCVNCPDGIYDFGVCSEERGGCGCFLASKVTIEGESCPKGHW